MGDFVFFVCVFLCLFSVGFCCGNSVFWSCLFYRIGKSLCFFFYDSYRVFFLAIFFLRFILDPVFSGLSSTDFLFF